MENTETHILLHIQCVNSAFLFQSIFNMNKAADKGWKS